MDHDIGMIKEVMQKLIEGKKSEDLKIFSPVEYLENMHIYAVDSRQFQCQRYYQLARIWWSSDTTNGEEYRGGTQLSTEMRTTPSVTYTHLDSASFSTSATSQSSTSYNLAIRVAAAASANGRYYVFGAVADSEL